MYKLITAYIFYLLFIPGSVFGQKESALDLRHSKAIQSLVYTKGTYAAPPKNADGTVDAEKIIKELKDIHANTYNWLIWGDHSGLAECEKFLPLARKAKINVWITLVPPSESPPFAKNYSEPFRLDYQKWAVEIAKLSVLYKNLVAWSIDDFVHNLQVFTPVYVKGFIDSSKAINPRLAFIPCSYFSKITPVFVKKYGSLLDGILFPYRNESIAANLRDVDQVTYEIGTLRNLFPAGFLLFLDVYATAHSSLGASTAGYVEQVVAKGLQSADGVLIYCHQDPERNAEKYKVIKEQFSKYH